MAKITKVNTTPEYPKLNPNKAEDDKKAWREQVTSIMTPGGQKNLYGIKPEEKTNDAAKNNDKRDAKTSDEKASWTLNPNYIADSKKEEDERLKKAFEPGGWQETKGINKESAETKTEENKKKDWLKSVDYVLEKRGYVPEGLKKYILKAPDGTVLGEIGHRAKLAVEKDDFDKYFPESDEEKKLIEQYKKMLSYKLYDKEGKEIGTIGYDAKQAFLKGELNTYVPKDINEKKTIDAYKKEYSDQQKLTVADINEQIKALESDKKKYAQSQEYDKAVRRYEAAGRSGWAGTTKEAEEKLFAEAQKKFDYYKSIDARINVLKNDKKILEAFERYDIDIANFDLNDLNKWAEEHNHEWKYYTDPDTLETTSYLVDKTTGGFLGFGRKSLASEQERKDVGILEELAKNNSRRKSASIDYGAFASGIVGFANGLTLGSAILPQNVEAKALYKQAGLDEKEFVSPSQTLYKTTETHPVANAVGEIGGGLVSSYAVGQGVYAGLGKIASGTGKTAQWLTTLTKKAPWAYEALHDGITFGITGGTRTAFEGGDFGDIVSSIARGSLSSAAGGAASELTRTGLNKLLTNTKYADKFWWGLKNSKGMLYTTSIASGFADAGADLAVDTAYALATGERTRDGWDIAADFGVALLYGTVGTAMRTKKLSADNRAYIENEVLKYMDEYNYLSKVAEKAESLEGVAEIAASLITKGENLKELLATKVLTGQNDLIKSVYEKIDFANEYIKEKVIKAYGKKDVGTKPRGDATTTSDVLKGTTSDATKSTTPVTPEAVAQRNTFTDELDEIASTEMPTVSAGDTFIDKTSNNIIKVVDRDDTVSTVEITTPDSKKETYIRPNEAVDKIPLNDRYKKVEPTASKATEDSSTTETTVSVGDVFQDTKSGSTITVVRRDDATTTVKAENGTRVNLREMPNKSVVAFMESGQFKRVTPTTETATTTETVTPQAKNQGIKVGDIFRNNKTSVLYTIVSRNETSTTVRNGLNSNLETMSNETADFIFNNTDATKGDTFRKIQGTTYTEPTAITETTTDSTPKTINLTRVGNFYEVYGDEAVAFAKELDMETDKANVNGVATDMLRLPAGLTVEVAERMGDEFNFNFSDRASVETTNTSTENVSDTTEADVAVVVDAINKTLRDGALEEIYASMEKQSVIPDISVWAERLIEVYKKLNNIGHIAGYFTDGGEKVISVIKSTMDTTADTKETVSKKETVESTPKTKPKTKANSKEATENSSTTETKETWGVKVGDVYQAGDITYTVTARDSENTTFEIKDKDGNVTPTPIKNEDADVILSDTESFTKVKDGNAATEETKSKSKGNKADAKNATTTKENETSNEIFIDDRTWEDASNRKVKAFQYDNLEVKPYYKAIAKELLSDLKNTIKGERFATGDFMEGTQEFTGISRFTSESIARIKDDTGATYDKIEDALKRIINDEGQENIALAKKIEFVIDDMLSGGYTDFEGNRIDADEDYLALKEELRDGDEDGEMYSFSSTNETESLEIEANVGYNGNTNYSLNDNDYLKAVENGDMETAQKMVDEAAEQSGYNIRAYHGTSRADRVGSVFLPERATSGPMAFFTDNKEIAEGYSKSKRDTSMAYDPDYDSYETQFRIKTKNGDIPLYRAWGYLPFDARNRITQKAQQLREDWDGDNEFILDPDNREANGGFQWQLKEARGNTLLALNEQWLNSGTLFNEESRFLEVLEMAGVMEEFKKIGLDSIYFKDPNARHEKVYDTYLRITKPFDTSLADNSFVDGLISWYEEQDESKYSRESMESDLWDKNGIDAYEFADRVRSDIENGTFYAWTSIPDSVTDYLKHLDYDGIKDLGGKNSDVGHTVWIPFSSEQIKSAEPVTYDDDGNVIPLSERFDEQDNDIRYSVEDYAPTFYSHMGNVIEEIKQDKIGANSVVSYLKGRGVKDEEIKWSGIETFLEGKKSVTKAELQEFVAGSQLQIEEQELGETIKYTDEQQRQLDRIDTDKRHLWDGVYELWDKLLPNTDLLDFMATDNTITMLSRIANAVKKSEKADTEDANRLLGYLDEIDSLELELRRIVAQAKASGQNTTKWSDYKLDGGENYRELLFKMPNSTYSNHAMRTHWGDDAKGILAHARVQDFYVDGEKMLFIEEIQSDWHNEGHTKGYADINKAKALNEKSYEIRKRNRVVRETLTQEIAEHLEGKVDNPINAAKSLLINLGADGTGSIRNFLIKKYSIPEDLISKIRDYDASMQEMAKLSLEASVLERGIDDAPFRDNYHEYVLKSLIRMAAEQGYDRIGWTPADIQSKRWSDSYAEGYRIEYDQDIPKFLNKYGKKWGAKVGRTPMEIDGFAETSYYVDDSGNRGSSYNDLIDGILTRKGISEDNFNDYSVVFTDDETIKIKNPIDGSYLDEKIHIVTEPSSVWTMPITDSMKDSVLYEGQPLYSVESEENANEQRRNDLLSGNSRRGNNASARKWSERISSFKQTNKGKNAKERQSFAKELLKQGKAEEVIDGKNKYTLVNPEAYNDDMLAMVEEAKAKGIELGFFLGEAKIKFDTKDEFRVNGIKKSGSKLLIRYDGKVPPQKLLKHETVHAKWRTKAMQTIKNTILNSLSEGEKNAILSQDRYIYYKKVYKGNMDKVWQEFVADVMADMNEYTAKHIDAVADYWYGNESAEVYSPSTYAESIDAGGKVASGNVGYTLSEGGESNETRTDKIGRTDSVSNGDRNSGRRSKSGRQNVPDGTAKGSNKAVNSAGHFSWGKKSEGSYTSSVGGFLENSKTEKETGGSRTDGRRFLEALEANDDTTARELLNKKALERGYTPVNVYHGTDADDVFTKFEGDNAIWVSTTEEYAVKYAADYVGEHSYLFGKDNGVYDLYIKKEKVLDVGNIDASLDTPKDVREFGSKIGFTEEEIIRCWNAGREYETNKVWAITNTPEFAEIARQYGYDTLQAVEGDDKVVTYGVLYRNNLKSAKLRTFDEDGNIIPLEERFSEDDDIRYSLADDGMLDLEDLWNGAVEKYGAIPAGEKPAREVQVPKKISDDKAVNRFARTMMEAEVAPDEAVSEFEKAILDGTMTHEIITNKNASEYAKNKIEELGFEEALARWHHLYEEGKVDKNEFALGMTLYNTCITNKDTKNAMKIAAELAAEATRAGQTVQACRMLKLMSPEGQLYYLEKSIQKINEEFKEKLGKKYEKIELDDRLVDDFVKAKDQEARDAAYEKICQNIADQIPTTIMDRWNAWRYLAMLGNFRTHLRNIVGNAIFVPAIRIKNLVGAVIERGARVDVGARTKSFVKDKKAVEFAKKDFDEVYKTVQGENAKYAVTSDIEGKRKIFKTRWLEWIRRKNFDFLEAEDMWFLKLHYTDALARVITAQNLDVTKMGGDELNRARAYAIKEAQAATYRDANSLAEALAKMQNKAERSRKASVRAVGILAEGVMPFKKTPLNIAKQGVLYSPVSILNGTYKGLKKLRDGKAYDAQEIVEDFAKGLTGTGIMMLGMWLASLGALVGPADEDKKKKAFDKMIGEQTYAFKIGDKSYTIDWAAPLSLTLFTGVELHRLTQESGFSMSRIVDALSTLPEPLLELSVFSGISDVIESAQYSDTNVAAALISDMATSYMLQALPTLGGQITRIIDGTKRNYYYVDKNKDVPKIIQEFIGQASSKIPLVGKFLYQPSVDMWGREETYGNVFERAFENLLSPGYYSKEQYSRVDRELEALYERTGEASVLPTVQEKYFAQDKIRYYMNVEDYTETKRIRGQKSFKLVNELITSDEYKKMTDEEKVKAIKKCYESATKESKRQMFEKVKSSSKTVEIAKNDVESETPYFAYSYEELAGSILSNDSKQETEIRKYMNDNGKTISKSALTREIKPEFISMMVDEPEKAKTLQKKLVLEYDYSTDTINNWVYDVYFDSFETNANYSDEIKSVASDAGVDFSQATIQKKAKTSYKTYYKEGKSELVKDLFVSRCKIPYSTLDGWEKEVDKANQKAETKRQQEIESLD